MMARSSAARAAPAKDNLRALLDELAEKAVKTILEDQDATPRGMSDVLKVAGSYWAVSRKGEDNETEPSAWEKYKDQMKGNGKEQDGPPN